MIKRFTPALSSGSLTPALAGKAVFASLHQSPVFFAPLIFALQRQTLHQIAYHVESASQTNQHIHATAIGEDNSSTFQCAVEQEHAQATQISRGFFTFKNIKSAGAKRPAFNSSK